MYEFDGNDILLDGELFITCYWLFSDTDKQKECAERAKKLTELLNVNKNLLQ